MGLLVHRSRDWKKLYSKADIPNVGGVDVMTETEALRCNPTDGKYLKRHVTGSLSQTHIQSINPLYHQEMNLLKGGFP